MLFAVMCTDKPDHQQVRLDNRPAHLEWLKTDAVKVHAAGPLLAPDGSGMHGSLLVIEAPDEATLRAALAADPYAKADLFTDVRVERWRWAVGRPDGVPGE